MPDRKYEKSNDRNYTLLDAKQRVIDLMANNQPLPSEGIYDEPVRYFKANEKWCAVIFGWLDWLEDVAGWKDAQDELHPGIQAILVFEEGIEIPTLPSEGDCLNYLPSASFVDFYPQNPYNQPDYIPPDYLVPPFSVNTNLEYPEIFGYQATDVMLNGAAINIDPINIVTLNFPRIVISVKGSGEVEIDFLAIQNGGYVVLKVGSMPNLADLIQNQIIETGVRVIDLNNDGGAIPNESDVVIAEEVFIDAEPDTITEIFCVFVPKLNDEITAILTFGGGIRAIQLCGFAADNTGGAELEDVRFNTETCTLEKRVGGVWSAIEGWEDWLLCIPDGGGMATKDDIRDGIYEAVNRLSAQVVSGGFTGFSVDEGGVVTVGSAAGDGVTLPEDDPSTLIDENAGARMGGAIAIAKALESVWDKIDAYFGTPSGAVTPVTAMLDAKTAMINYFGCDPILMEVAVDNYYTWRLAGSTRILFDQPASFAQYLYCNGWDYSSLSRWVIDNSGWIVTKQNIALAFWKSLLPDFFSNAFAKGSQAPSTSYQESSCYPSPTEIVYLLALGTSYNSQTAWKANHRLLLTVEHWFIDTNGSIQDFWWQDLYNAAPANHIATTNIQQGAGITKPTINQVPYSTGHKYQFTLDTQTAGTMQLTVPSTGMVAPITQNTPDVGIKVTIQDLGEISL